jgi:hypothetical protein
MAKVISAQERKDWAESPVTKELVNTLRNSKQEAMEAWAGETFIGKTSEETVAMNAAALGGVRVLVALIGDLEEAIGANEFDEGESA